ncbi:tRNA uracil 4-sulfurtransferase ThiI [Methanonatronarchaeum sp. AMET-Sl]|uniref:tRNA uracil 4-sulfurtransferase ThiI n=1 Tax=Methanonatronarchaeum sp. AMET-Sl TaxID=3037654 RepID=UPI00244DE10E|nr:tRNA uracil 4-sulfurtransferase ThiI [Methanonatronarchaeum sp. AMET-Sl]WGI18148.1 tRNA 4-thiouridine(8) synthase ThiI [Methanonatronarchaeum sp. AMET-Sl]
MKWDLILIRYGEIALKSSYVRRQLIEKLKSHIIKSLKQNGISEYKLRSPRGRIFLETDNIQESLEALSYVSGIVSYSPCITVPTDIDKIIETSINIGEKHLKDKVSFAVNARRIGDHNFTSQDLENTVGNHLRKKYNSTVDLDNPDFTVNIEVRNETTYIFIDTYRGLGGLPYGVQGKVVSLFSGGIDSPVATSLMIKRGCEPIALYIDKGRYGDKRENKRAVKVAKKLSRYTPNGIKYIQIDFEDIYNEIKNNAGKKTCIICKRAMYKAAEKISKKTKAKGIVTGESIGQVASQTLDNLMTLDESTKLPVYRPLTGFDKTQTQQISIRLGLYKESKKDVGDCPILPNKVSTISNINEIKKLENQMNINKHIEQIIEETTKKQTLTP